jgi:hypothetical protein
MDDQIASLGNGKSGAAFEIDFGPTAATETNDFDRPPNVTPLKPRTGR